MSEENQASGRRLESTTLGKFTLLNNEKLTRVMDLLEGIKEPANSEEARLVEICRELGNWGVLAMYDRFGGGVRLGVRKINLGTFYDFAKRAPREETEIEDDSEDSFEDEYELVPKRSRKNVKNESAAERLARMNNSKSAATETTKTAAKKTTKTAAKTE